MQHSGNECTSVQQTPAPHRPLGSPLLRLPKTSNTQKLHGCEHKRKGPISDILNRLTVSASGKRRNSVGQWSIYSADSRADSPQPQVYQLATPQASLSTLRQEAEQPITSDGGYPIRLESEPIPVRQSSSPPILTSAPTRELLEKLQIYRLRLSSCAESPRRSISGPRKVNIDQISASKCLLQVPQVNEGFVSELPHTPPPEMPLRVATAQCSERDHSPKSFWQRCSSVGGLNLRFGQQNVIPALRIGRKGCRNNLSIAENAASLVDGHDSNGAPLRLDELHRRVMELEYEVGQNRADVDILMSQETEIAELRQALNYERALRRAQADAQHHAGEYLSSRRKGRYDSFISANLTSSSEIVAETVSPGPSCTSSTEGNLLHSGLWI